MVVSGFAPNLISLFRDTVDLYRAGSGFKLHVQNLRSLALNLGPHTTSPLASIAVSVDYNNFTTVNVSSGTNVIPLEPSSRSGVVRINVEGWQNNRINLESLVLNSVGF